MKVGIVTIAYNTGELLEKLFKSAMLTEQDVSFYLFLHSEHRETVEYCDKNWQEYAARYYPHCTNRGVALSWNDGSLAAFDDGNDVVIICNDDIEFSPGDIDKIAKKAMACRKNYLISCAGFHVVNDEWRTTHGYSCFALNPIAIERVGCFDENFFPAYLEDIDHHRRATMLGLVEENCSDTAVTHIGSRTIASDYLLSIKNMHTQQRNMRYMEQKWDVISHIGGYMCPFNNVKFDLKIRIEDRHAPYPGYNREKESDNV